MKKSIYTSIFIVFLLHNTTLLAQSHRALKYIPNTAQVVLSFEQSLFGTLLNQEEWAAQKWLIDLVQPLQATIMGKRKVRELIGILTHFPTTVGIDTSEHWHFVSERDTLGITQYTLFMPMQNISLWLDFVQKSLPLYTSSDLKLSSSTIFYLQRDNFIIAWNREHIRISCFILPNDHQYTPTFVEYKTHTDRQVIPRLLPSANFSLLSDTIYLKQLSQRDKSLNLRLADQKEIAFLALSQVNNQTVLQYQQSKSHFIFSAAYFVNFRNFQFDLSKIGVFAPFFPPRTAYAFLTTKLNTLPPLQISSHSPTKYTFKIPLSIRYFLLLFTK